VWGPLSISTKRGTCPLEDEYANSQDRAVYIGDLARAIAAAAGEINLAKHPTDLFESEAAYSRCFNAKRLRSLTLLTFLQNIHDVIFVVLKKDIGLTQRGPGPRPASLGYHAMCLLLRHLAKNKMHDFVSEFGRVLWGRANPFRERVAKVLGNYHSGIKGVLKEKFMPLPDARADSQNGAFRSAEATLRLRDDIDVFSVFAELDDESPVEPDRNDGDD